MTSILIIICHVVLQGAIDNFDSTKNGIQDIKRHIKDFNHLLESQVRRNLYRKVLLIFWAGFARVRCRKSSLAAAVKGKRETVEVPQTGGEPRTRVTYLYHFE